MTVTADSEHMELVGRTAFKKSYRTIKDMCHSDIFDN